MSSPFAAFARIALYENGVDGTSKKFEKTVTNNDDKKKKTEKRSDLKISAEKFWTKISPAKTRDTPRASRSSSSASAFNVQRGQAVTLVAGTRPTWRGPRHRKGR